ncbi:MAG: hypothetical protein JXQ77_04645, partial [Campylobacterales bacterium]|nr:hypothetical protein [Campylobacterales bacterium]
FFKSLFYLKKFSLCSQSISVIKIIEILQNIVYKFFLKIKNVKSLVKNNFTIDVKNKNLIESNIFL